MNNPTSEHARNGYNADELYTSHTKGSVPHAEPKAQATLMRFADALDGAVADAAAAHEARKTGQPRGPVTNFPKLDKELGGAFAPGVHAIHGDPGAGKTAFALQVATTCQFPALFVTAEMAPAELLRRQAARITSTYLGRFKSGEMPPTEVRGLLLRGIAAAPQFALLDATREPASPVFIRDCAAIIKGDAPNLLIVIDSLHSWAEGNASGNEYEVLNEAIASLRRLSSLLDCPVVYIAERNRISMGKDGQSSGAGSRKIEYGAETVISLNRDADSRPDVTGNVPVMLKLPKNRHGVPGVEVRLSFNGALQRFSEDH